MTQRPMPILRGPDAVLRPWRPGDALRLVAALNEPSIVRWYGVALPYELHDAEGFIAAVDDRWTERTAAHFALADVGTDQLIGYLGIMGRNGTLVDVELGYWVMSEYRGRGLAKWAVSSAVEWCNRVLQPARIEASMLVGNDASAAVVEAAGFRREGIRIGVGELDGQPADEVVYVWGD